LPDARGAHDVTIPLPARHVVPASRTASAASLSFVVGAGFVQETLERELGVQVIADNFRPTI